MHPDDLICGMGQIFAFIERYDVQLIATIIIMVAFFSSRKISAALVKRYGVRHEIELSRILYTTKYVNFVITVVALMMLGVTWDISFEGLSVYFISFFTVAGGALFAAWSILSNITASILLFFYYPFRIGSQIRIIDGDNSVEGLVYDMTMFSIFIRTDDGMTVAYPNNLAIQKPIKLIKQR